MKKFYITTTLPYVNADPHIGFALEIIQADVIARHYRKLGYDVFFNTGTDEHGLKIFRRAKENNMEPQAYCDIYAEKFKDLKGALNLSYNSFIRTTDPGHIKAARRFWELCEENGDIYKKKYKTKYCVGCELEKTDSELVNGRCPIHPNLELEIIEEENYFFRFSKYQKKLEDFYKKNPKFVIPPSRYNEIKEFTSRGLEDFSVSRLKEKMPWGIPVPRDEGHVMFVWFDALINYISSLGWPGSGNFEIFWPGLQVAGKDNLRQQSSIWQAMLMSAGISASKQIFIHGFITSGGKKISKSLGNAINPIELSDKYGIDAVRYYLLREIPSVEDGDFTYEKFENRYNSDLASGIGNLASRVRVMAEKISKDKGLKNKITNKNIKREIGQAEKNYEKALTEFKFNEALKAVWELISGCDKFITDEKPWEGKENSGKAISDLVLALKKIADFISPFLPGTSEKIIKEFEISDSGDFKNKRGEAMFPRLEKK